MWRAPANTMIDTIHIDGLTVLRARPSRATRPPALFVHGFFAEASVFAGWLEVFAARGAPAYAVNLRGRAGSRQSIDLGGASIDDFTDDAAVLARQLGAPTVIGHSMGGLIAQRLAERELVSAAVLISPAPPAGISLLSPAVVYRELSWLPAMLANRLVHPTARSLRSLVLNHVPAAEQDAVLGRFVADSGRAAREMGLRGVPVDARHVTCPVLVIAADDDRFIAARVGRRVAARYRAAFDLRTGHGHMLPIEPGWEAMATEVLQWIASHDVRGTTARPQ